jgi:hypothetical protein
MMVNRVRLSYEPTKQRSVFANVSILNPVDETSSEVSGKSNTYNLKAYGNGFVHDATTSGPDQSLPNINSPNDVIDIVNSCPPP